jgi:hypothetical protein
MTEDFRPGPFVVRFGFLGEATFGVADGTLGRRPGTTGSAGSREVAGWTGGWVQTDGGRLEESMGEESGEEAGVELSRSDFLEDWGEVSEDEVVGTGVLVPFVLVRFGSLSVIVVGVTGVTGVTGTTGVAFVVVVSVGDFIAGCWPEGGAVLSNAAAYDLPAGSVGDSFATLGD